MATWSTVAAPRFTLRMETVWSALSSQTKSPLAPVRTAVTGTTTAPTRVSRPRRTLTNWLGNRAPSALANRALARTVPVVVSTWLSRVEKVPWPRVTLRVRSSAVTGRVARDARDCTCGTWSCGTVNSTSIGATSVSTTRPLESPTPM